jgi:hypothetical protein
MAKATINDLWYAYLLGSLPPSQGGSATGTVVLTPQQANKWGTKQNANTSSAPVQFAVLANVTVADGAGLYVVKMTYGYGATAEATTSDNFQLVVNSTGVISPPAPVATNNTMFPRQDFTVNLNNGDVVKVITNIAASASSVYKTMLTVERIA